jgi:hypothetical protein
MSDDEYGWSSEDDEQFAATTDVAQDGKRKLTSHDVNSESLAKRNRHEESTVNTPSASTVLANRILKDCFRLNGFRLQQERAITRLIDGGSAVVVFPTGGGKSLCYQASRIPMHRLTDLTCQGACCGVQIPRRTAWSPDC